VLTEMRLPFLDGGALSTTLRRDSATVDVPILVVTADSRRSVIDRARCAGADTVLIKPILIDDLVSAMRALLTEADHHVGPVGRRPFAGKDVAFHRSSSLERSHLGGSVSVVRSASLRSRNGEWMS
jgi:DNA-binding response OmpR family regulator